MISRQPYHGSRRKLVLAFDVGTTYSGISYSILDPGEIPLIKGVTRFPSQENVGGDSKIPSILFYSQGGQVCAVGAEALQESVNEKAEDENWMKLEWWKLYLRPKTLATSQINDNDIPASPLPRNKSAVEVLADFMEYLFKCARTYIQDTNLPECWESIKDDIDFVLTHPNGWEGAQQSQIRRAAVLAKLIPDTPSGHSRIQLLTEGEASLHFCIEKGLASDTTANGQGIMIVDAGGGTIDLSAYYMTLDPASFEEIAPTECRLQGSVFVTSRAGTFLQDKLQRSKFGTPKEIADITSCFDKTTKLRFRNPDEPSYIKFGSVRDKDLTVGIRSGQLKLPGSEVAALFEPSIQGIIDAIEQQRRAASRTISSIFLVGGFAASDWLFSRLQAHLVPSGVNFCRPDSHVNKAVADGAISFYLDHRVSVRVAKKTYGVACNTIFDPTDPEHIARSHTLYIGPSGHQYIRHKFTNILSKGTRVSEDKEFRRDYVHTRSVVDELSAISADIESYQGALQEPRWTDIEPEMFSTLCTVQADLSQMSKAMVPQRGRGGAQFYKQEFSVVLLFGLTELKAHISWMENGEEKRSPAKVVYDLGVTVAR